MNWAEVIAEKTLRDLPYKIELDRYGNIVLRSPSNSEEEMRAKVALYLDQRSQSVFHVDPRSELNK